MNSFNNIKVTFNNIKVNRMLVINKKTNIIKEFLNIYFLLFKDLFYIIIISTWGS